ncbi:MAG: hypothetical protein ACRDG4_06220, partial [Chloroflexota bacterium]
MISRDGAAEQQSCDPTLPRNVEVVGGRAGASKSARLRRLPWAAALLLVPATGLLLIFLFGPIVQAIRVATT